MSQTVNTAQAMPGTSREELVYLLSRAADLEHSLACSYFFAAYSLKNDVSEGGLSDEQAEGVRRWRQQLSARATGRMRNLAQISNLLTAIGGAPHVTRPRLPLATSDDTGGPELILAPFSPEALNRLAAYERFDTPLLVLRRQSSDGARIIKEQGDSVNLDSVAGVQTTPRDLYARITAGFGGAGQEDLFIGPSQVTSELLNLGGEQIAVSDAASALAAIASIMGITEGINSPPQAGSAEAILGEYLAAEAAAEGGQPFEPVRPVGPNPTTHQHADNSGSTGTGRATVLINEYAVALAGLFNNAYDLMLLMLQRFLTYGDDGDDDRAKLAQSSLHLMTIVVRPLGDALTRLPANSASHSGVCAGLTFGDSVDLPEVVREQAAKVLFAERLWELATEATTLRLLPDMPTEIQEISAGLQDLVYRFISKEDLHNVETRLAALKEMQAGLESTIQASLNGPYLVTNADAMFNWLGERIETRPQMALCRCGGSANKPFCDGTHASIGFTGQKDPNRVADRRDTFIGQQVTVLDNRGTCAHSGFCTDRLAGVFHVGSDPFVTPSGGRMDEIIQRVRACPSGALSYAIDGKEARDQVDQPRNPAIEVSKDGPYRLTGGIPIKDRQGNDEARNEGASRGHYSLCRCGHSQNKPFCSGMHWYVNFHDPVVPADHEPSVFEWAGGLPALTRMTHLFYEKYVPQDPLIGPLFAQMSADHPERVSAWLGEVFGGPTHYSDLYGDYARMLSQHVGKHLSEEQRARWVSLIVQAANEAGLPNDAEFRAAFVSYIEWGSRVAWENSQQDARPPEHMPMPHWSWVANATPGARVSALAPQGEGKAAQQPQQEPALPGPDEVVSFNKHIKPLFRPTDRQSMKFAFDLWSYEDDKKHADAILERLQKGSMPCDGAWPQEKIVVFERWVKSGTPE